MVTAYTPTERQLRVWRSIHGLQAAKRGVSPSVREIKADTGITSTHGVHEALCGLEERGLIRRLPRQARAIELLQLPPPVSCAPDGAPLFFVPLQMEAPDGP